MTKKNYIHSLNVLKEKRKELENEIEIIDDEINFTNKDYINRNAEYKIGDKVEFQNRIYKIDCIFIVPDSISIVYDLISNKDSYCSQRNKYNIYEYNLKLIERNNNDFI